VRVTVVASGSQGNATCFESGGTRLLVDAGVGPVTLARRLEESGSREMPTAVLITHAHGDHIGHVGAIARKLRIPVYMSEGTARVARICDIDRVRVYGAREPFTIGALTVSPRPVPHDAAQVALVVSNGSTRAALATDLGEIPPGFLSHFGGCEVVLIESNHDAEMLAHGPYLPHLKRRVASARGHLSNRQTHELLRRLPPGTNTVVLMHLSGSNNRRDIALEVASDALHGRRIRLFAAEQDVPLVIDAGAPRVAEPVWSPRARPRQLSLWA
jgi:phosphoribosyl 1,2-cyclic phosphodiesterase